MGGYAVNFTVYTMAMIGLIFFALFVYKKFSCFSSIGKKSDYLSIEESINISPRKSLYVVNAGGERFLIASDTDRTTLISKLDAAKNSNRTDKSELIDLPVIIDFNKKKETPVIKEMLNKINNI